MTPPIGFVTTSYESLCGRVRVRLDGVRWSVDLRTPGTNNWQRVEFCTSADDALRAATGLLLAVAS